MPPNDWTFQTTRHGTPKRCPLYLHWEVNGSAMSDDYTPSEITASELLDLWHDRYGHQWTDASIHWGVDNPKHGVFEFAPFHGNTEYPEDFLTHFTWPVNTATGEYLRWSSLPVVDLRWNPKQGDKGGFIQEATGWKPGAFQRSVQVDLLMNKPTITPDRR